VAVIPDAVLVPFPVTWICVNGRTDDRQVAVFFI
jgi:hypothetical protein